MYNDDLSLKQIKNVKRKLVSWIWDATPRRVVALALFCGINIPKNILAKYISEKQD